MAVRVEQAAGSCSVGERALQKCHIKLRRELDVQILLPYLIQGRLITADVYEELMLQAPNAMKVDKLVTELPRSGEQFLERFIKCLQDSAKDEPGTSHEQIADVLQEELRCRNAPGFISTSYRIEVATAPSDNIPDGGQSQRKLGKGSRSVSEHILRKCHLKLQKELNILTVLPYLNKYRLVTADVHEDLMLQASNATKVEKLVAELPRSGEDFLERFIECLRESAKEEPGTCHEQIADVLEEELKYRNSPGYVPSGSLQITVEMSRERTPLLVQHGHPRQPNQIGVQLHCDTVARRKARNLKLKQICCNRWCYCYTTILLIAVLLLLLLIILSKVPHISYVRPEYVYKNSTAELQFDNMPWLYYAEMALKSSSCSPSEGYLYVIKNQDCSNLPSMTTKSVDFWNPFDHVYMRPGSTINITVTSSAVHQVWILPDYRYNEYKDHYNFNCQQPPSGVHCFETSEYLNESFSVTLSDSAYYYVIPLSLQKGIFTIGINASYNRVLFNTTAILPFATTTTLSSEFTPIDFRKPFSYEKTCVLLNYPSESFCVTPFKVQVSNVSRGEDILIYPGILLFICLVLFFVIVSVHVYCHRNCSLSKVLVGVL